jgi:hypothetical protein
MSVCGHTDYYAASSFYRAQCPSLLSQEAAVGLSPELGLVDSTIAVNIVLSSV